MALERELRARGHDVVRELGVRRLDMVVDDKLIVEVKSTLELHKSAHRQLSVDAIWCAVQALVFDATQFSSINVGTMNGKMPYSVSLTECELWSIAMNTLMQKSAARTVMTTPA